jgi:hypothetical protein
MIQDPANTAWGSGLLSVTAPTIITSSIAPQKVFDAVIPANELSFEVWVRPENATLNGAARIFNIATDVAADAPTNRNFMFGQDNANIDARLRTTTTSNNGIPELVSDPGGPVVTEPTELLHLLYTRDASGVARTYVNGIEHALLTTVTGDLSNWDLSYRVSLAHEFADSAADSRSWRGDYHLLAMWNRALAPGEVVQRFDDGPVAPGGMPLLPGDVDGDGDVDLEDYGVIRDNFLVGVSSRAEGDLNFDRVVDWTDFREWKNAFSGAAGSAAAMPEPGTLGLMLVAAGLAAFASRRAAPSNPARAYRDRRIVC